MNKVDKLIIKAKKAAQSKAERFVLGMVHRHHTDKAKWIADGELWTGKHGSRRCVTTEHDSVEAAAAALQALAEEYPNTEEEAVILIDDFDDGS